LLVYGQNKELPPPWELGKGGVLEDVRFWVYKTVTSSWVGDRNGTSTKITKSKIKREKANEGHRKMERKPKKITKRGLPQNVGQTNFTTFQKKAVRLPTHQMRPHRLENRELKSYLHPPHQSFWS